MQPRNLVPYKLRPSSMEDLDRLFEIHKSALRVYVDETWGWNERWQRQYFADHFDLTLRQVIVVEGQTVGFLDVERAHDRITVHNIEISPEFQGRRIGSSILRNLVEESTRRSCPLLLQVLKVNVRAHSLYQRLGFVDLEETATHFKMIRKPCTARS